MNSIYIHIPFCQSRCIYCDFYSTTHAQGMMASYVQALIREMSRRKHYIECSRVNTLYIGGGTPSLLPAELLNAIFEAIHSNFTLTPDAEVTIEANPDDINNDWLKNISQTPINRISIGTQTFDDQILNFIGRRHNAKQTIKAVDACKQAGITNISLDLISSLPGQTMQHWQKDVDLALSLGITHLSAYTLSYEEGTKLYQMLINGDIKETDEELSRQMYYHLLNTTEKAGFQQYEISNFSLPGQHSRHNSCYWQGTPYLGLGAGAHSYDGIRTRRANLPNIKTYINATDDVPHENEILNDNELYNEFVMTRLRTTLGIPLDKLTANDRQYCLNIANPYIEKKLLSVKNNHLHLTKEGIFISNDIISDLMRS
ncbi:MAG: radical SAM family heme chaperone HemW [Bacteroidaceae bacterium]|nr:radical SAM family heme chaperone HemW [Bacteroidaceae bacterium]